MRSEIMPPASKPLPNRPDAKMPPVSKGFRIRKRPLSKPISASQKHSAGTSSHTGADRHLATFEPDGSLLPARGPRTAVIYVSSGAPFMALVKRVRKALDRDGPQKTKGMSLTTRVAALAVENGARHRGETSAVAAATATGAQGGAFDDVVLVGTGRAIQKTVDVGAFFSRETELDVGVRTRSLCALDDIVVVDEDLDEEDQTRVRYLSCLEVGIRWKP